MSKIYDVIIVGAGPSGSSCAYNIKRADPSVSVLLLDKAEFPRYKPCGGGISPEVSNYLDFDLSPAIDSVCDDIAMVVKGREISSRKNHLWMVRREVFDSFLLKQAQTAGAELVRCDVKEILTENVQHSRVMTHQGEFSGKIIVLAEGGKGNLAKKMGFASKGTVLAAMEYEHYTSKLNGKLYIDFDYHNNGYAWNFPKSDGLSLGIGGFIKGKSKSTVKLPQKLRSYATQFEVKECDKDHLHGHPIMLYSGKRKLVVGNIVLIGEAAGCVDPLTAEGIRPAIKSGFLAAQTIVSALSHNNLNHLLDYTRQFHKRIGSDFRYARIISYFLNQNTAKIVPMLASTAALDTFMSVFSGRSTYREQAGFRRLSKFVWKALF